MILRRERSFLQSSAVLSVFTAHANILFTSGGTLFPAGAVVRLFTTVSARHPVVLSTASFQVQLLHL